MKPTPHQASTVGPETLAASWYEAFQREALAEDGDVDALISTFREASERAEPHEPAHQAFSIFMGRIREEDLDLEEDALE